MKSKTDLPELIRAMSKSEKRYFTLDAQKSGRQNSRYLELFQAINDMADYDEDQLRDKFGSNLPSDKAYLYDAILRSMRDYRSSRSYSARIKEMILDAKYLYERGLYDQCEERLAEAKKLALELDDQLALLEINKENRTLAFGARKDYSEKIRQLIYEKDNNIKALTEEFKLLDLGYELLLEWKKNLNPRHPERQKLLADLSAEGFPDDRYIPESAYAKRLYFQCAGMYAQLLGNRELTTEYYLKTFNWWEINPKQKNEEFTKYIADVSNLLNAYSIQGKYEFLPDILDKLDKEDTQNYHEKAAVFQRSSIYRLMYFINISPLHGVDPVIRKIEKGLSLYQINTPGRLVILFNVAVLLFINERFEEVRLWVKKIRDLKTTLRQDIQKGAQTINLIAGYESLDPEEFDKNIRSTRRFFQKLNLEKSSFEFNIMEHFRKLAGASIYDSKNVMEEIRQLVLSFQQQDKASIPLGLDELILHYVDARQHKGSIIDSLKKQRNAVRNQTP